MNNTIKSTLRTYKAAISRIVSRKREDGEVEDILNNFKYNDNLSSSGQPTEQQFSLICRAGYSVIINLAPYDLIEAPLKGESKIVTNLGMKYIHIPVHFLNPTQDDFNLFVDAMQNVSCRKVWVHCAAGMRASAFLYRYRCTILGEDTESAVWDLRETWEPFGTWKKFTFKKARLHTMASN